ncbi:MULTISPECIES: TetR/AcrR family transcriptional regulator [Virgibacillus]|uniref:TetR family transcriptional regulator n=1 Tax=Virgibacillus pantothenticus TaxID=1473 RepID=A0A0L0QJX1_VIRPA|nr:MULTISPECIES: TetR/AcrR family transcriptional regulator [Virgibacillus]API92888.1 TetR family transcriptional regulator [Virgibacillus sp. 6R]KNE18877.1 TetR family transcriptional regulator [Virgibacillus pantothenticus]MBS7428404.1 TetR/AcrR family transcriptional regulator [Virgibacillus sp. 19R1-5]MBU8565163.1 TetR/AcrR family transcriptional regulator [Virgibacillus pantothenticus]MBU8601447.1 TetR/AcrR family transcriptional regulator [Virgibacillus pantothenticus]
MSARKAVAKELTRDMILQAANNLFVEKGYQHVSMRQIATKLNYSHGSLYYHFKNKAELFFALVEKHFQLLDERMCAIQDKDIPDEEKLRQLMQDYIAFGLTHQSHYEIMFLIRDDEVRTFMQEAPMKAYQRFAHFVANWSEETLSVQVIWSMFLSLHGFVTHYLRHVNEYADVEQMAKRHVDLLLQWTKTGQNNG